jgi:photosystem II stability/assembly factor-like uncharacterized protein
VKPPTAGAATPLGGALHALGSKPAWIAIGVLLVNDNYLKYAFPSALTGKLSDVAELFVLPLAVVVVALSISPVLPWRAVGISIATYAAVGIAFIALKTDAQFANTLRAAIGPVTGGGTVGVIDPTDLLALPALLVSFALLYRGLRSQVTASPRWRALPVLGLVVFASVANTPGVPPNVQLLADPTHAGVFYAMYVDEDYYGGTYPRDIYRTVDAGQHWTRMANGAQRFALDPEVPGGLLTLDRDTVSAVRGDQPNTAAASATPPSTHQLYGARRLFLVTGWPSRDILIVRDGSLIRSRDRGSSWITVRDAAHLEDVAAAGVDGTLYAIEGGRTLRSTDYAATWDDLGPFPTEYVRLGVDPRDADRLVAATSKGMYLSADGGSTWRSTWNKRTIAFGRDFSARIVFDPDHPERVYATLGTDVGLLVSRDGGATWGQSELPALSVAVGREPGPRVFIHADYRGVYHESRPWPELEPWVKVNLGLPFH